MAENYVQIRVKATDTAKPELDSLRADLDELGSKVESAKIDVNDREAKAKLLDLNAQLAAVGHRLENPRITVAGAAKAEADLARIDDRFEKLKESADKAREHATEDLDRMREHASRLSELVSRLGMGSGLLGKLMFGSRGGEGAAADAEQAAAKIKDSVGGIVGALRKLPGGGGAEGGGSALGMFGQLGSLAAGGGAIAMGLGAILVEVDGLVSGFAAAGAGVGAFAILAAPAVSKVSNALTQLKTDQLAYSRATTAAARSSALKKIHDDWKALDPAERGAVRGIQRFEGSLSRMSKAFEPAAFKVFNDALKIANQLLPDLKPFADTAATALDGLLRQAGKFVGSTGFKDWLAQFQKLEGPSITAIGRGIGHVAGAIGKLLTAMSAKDVVNAINIAFSILSGTINALTFIIRRIMLRWDQWQQLFRHSRHEIAEVGHDIATVFDRMRHDIAAAVDAVVHRIEQDTDHIRTNLVHWAQDVGQATGRVVAWFRSLPGRVMSALASLPGRLFSFGAHIISMLAAGIRSAIGDVTGAIGSIASEITSHLPFSPAKKGPLSGSGDPEKRGRRIAELLARGISDGSGAVDAAANRLTGGARFGGGRGGAGGGGELTLRLELVGSDSKFMTALMNQVRVQGGDPRMFQRKVAFR